MWPRDTLGDMHLRDLVKGDPVVVVKQRGESTVYLIERVARKYIWVQGLTTGFHRETGVAGPNSGRGTFLRTLERHKQLTEEAALRARLDREGIRFDSWNKIPREVRVKIAAAVIAVLDEHHAASKDDPS